MTPLRQRFIDDLRLRNYATRTIETYVWHVAAFAKHFGRSPDQLGAHAVRAYQLHLLAQQRSWSRFNQAVCALRFFFGTTLARPEQLPSIPYGKRPHKLPSVLSADEVLRLINAAKAGRDRLLLQVAYGCGLRLSEVAHLRVADIDSARMVLHVRQGRAPKTASCRSRNACSTNCVPTGGCTGRAPGSFPGTSRISRSAWATSSAASARRIGVRRCARHARCTRSDTATPRIWSKPVSSS